MKAKMKKAHLGLILFSLLALAACGGGLRYSQLDPAAKEFHPRHLAVFPVDVGTYEEARDVADTILAGVVMEKKAFKEVTASDAMREMLKANEELRKTYQDYTLKLKTVNFSDPELSRKIGSITKADAFLLVNIDYWLYTQESGKKVGKVGMAMKLVETSTGRIMWKAGHFLDRSYSFIKPDLKDIARDVAREMLSELPN